MAAGAPLAEVPSTAPAAAEADGRAPLVDRASAAWLTSVVLHVAAGGVLGAVTWSLPAEPPARELSPLEVVSEDELPPAPQEFAASDKSHDAVGALSALGELSAVGSAAQFAEESLVAREAVVVTDLAEPASVGAAVNVLQGPELLDAIEIQGVGSVGLTGAAGAVDRLTQEILASLEQRPTLVVWLFDQSGSLRGERTAIVERFRRIYQELGEARGTSRPAADAEAARRDDAELLTAVVGFGAAPRMLTRRPTAEFAAIEAAVAAIEDDATGQENIFTAIAAAAERFRKTPAGDRGRRRVMIVAFTDEAGDDADLLDETAERCRQLGIAVYVVGRPAPFGRDTAYVKWVDPDPNFDQRPQWTPVRLGPESALPEALKLRFADRRDEELLDSGFGPYALTRLCYETGGLYFSTHPNRAVGRQISGAETSNLAAHFSAFFDPDVMRRYQPEYVSTGLYRRDVERRPMRRALVEAAELSWASPLENVRLRFPKRDDAQLARDVTEAQRAAAAAAPKIDAICRTLEQGVAGRAEETEARWQAGFDLALGRALAAKVRTDGYNVMLAELKQGAAFANPRNNTWVLRTAGEFADSKLERLAAEAERLLKQVERDHPGTPWALHAERELTTPLGWRWVEGFTRLPPEGEGGEPPRPTPEPPPGPVRRDPPPL